jgi:DNA-directed DNA polymerase III PolC
MKKSPFVSLHNHTELGSPLDGMNDTYDLFVRAKEVDHAAVAVTDHGTMTALFDAWEASKKTGVKLVPGVEAYFADDLNAKKNNHMVFLAKNADGYRNLLKLNYESFKNQSLGYMGKRIPRISWEHIEKFNSGIICLTACSNGLIAKTLITDQDEGKACSYIKRLNSIFKDNFYLEIQPHSLYHKNKNGSIVDQKALNESLIRISHDYNIPYVITCDAHYRDADHAKYHDFMLAVKDKAAFDDPDRFRYGVQDMYLKTHEELISHFGEEISSRGMKSSIDILSQCETPSYLEPKGPILPKFPVKDEPNYDEFVSWKNKNAADIPEDKAYLRYKCIKGFDSKFYSLPKEERKDNWERVKKELKVLEEKDFSSYMLIVSDYTDWAKKHMPVGPGRGSAAGSLVAYITNITSINPMEYGLIFERFHNSEKESFPDIDTDFAEPSKVKDYLKKKYGEDRVASISNWLTMSPKVAIKDAAKSLRLGGDISSAFKISNYLTSVMPDEDTIDKAIEASNNTDSKEFALALKKYPELYEYATKLEGLTRNWSIHAAGVIISDRPIHEIAPLRIEQVNPEDPSTWITITQWEKNRCEKFGFVKMDCLGLKTLVTIDETLNTIRDMSGPVIDLESISLDDPDTYKMIGDGGTSGVFQLESAMTPLCIAIKPTDIEGIAAINALGRPSCLPEVRLEYIDRVLGLEPIKFDHPKLKRALEKTAGILLYEESAMYVAADVAGWDFNQADSLRKLSKLKGKNPELAIQTEKNFLTDSVKNGGLTYEESTHIWSKFIEPMSGYSFNKSLHYAEKISVVRDNKYTVLSVEDIISGDKIPSRSESTGEHILVTVVDLYDHGILPLFKVTFDSDKKVSCTLNHKFRTSEGDMLPLWMIIQEELSVISQGFIMDRIKDIEYIGKQQTYDIEVSHEDHQFYLANGVLTSNSHSISYSKISYWTAWLRCHFPTEFMSSLLNSEDPNSDKTQEYINECKKMGIKIRPPDIMLSRGLYAVTGDHIITTGLSAVKGVGEAAIIEIINAKPKTLQEFFAFTEGRVVNKRVIESLAKAGAFECFGLPRKDMFENYQKYRVKVNFAIKKLKEKLADEEIKNIAYKPADAKELKQFSKDIESNIELSREQILFAIKDVHFTYTDEDWSRVELLSNELEVLGRTVSGQLHEIFGSFFNATGGMTTALSKINLLDNKEKIRVEVILKSMVKEFSIKNGKNVGRKFAKYMIEDIHGDTAELTLWADDYDKYRSMLKDGIPLKAICAVNEYMSQKSLALVSFENIAGKRF